MTSNGFTATTSRHQTNTALAWQKEVTSLRSHYQRVTTLLQASVSLSSETVACYRSLQQMLVNTLSCFLTEIDSLSDTGAPCPHQMQPILVRHIATMKRLNQAADSMARTRLAQA